MSKPTLGQYIDHGVQASIDLPRLIVTRMLVTANSGGGKSRALRRLFEQLAGKVQQLIVDPEGEFASLREKHDFIICAAQGGDVEAHPRTAGLLARRLLETEASAVLDISELKAHERHRFVKLFLESLIEAPKELRHPTIVAVDEAQLFAPEKDESEALGAMLDVGTRGRKRGLCMVAATLRMSLFNKGIAAELKNRLIGGISLDVDLKRAAFDLGLTPHEARDALRALKPGQFYAFGPAIHQLEPRVLLTGDVETTHPEAGTKLRTTAPKPTAAIVALLPRLADLPKEAETEARSIEDLRRELATARRELTLTKKAQPPVTPAATPALSRQELKAIEDRGYERGVAAGRQEAQRATVAHLRTIKGALHQAVDTALAMPVPALPDRPPVPQAIVTTHPAPQKLAPATRAALTEVAKIASANLDGSATPVQQRILNALAELEQMGASDPDRELVAFMSNYSNVNSKGFANAIGTLRTAGLINPPSGDGKVTLTDEGRARAEPASAPRTAAELQERVIAMLGGASGRILKPLIDAYPSPMNRDSLAEAAGYGNVNSKGFANAIGRLSGLGFIHYPERGQVAAKPVLFLES